jgi:CRISPR/Cas system endoribonuclease Cas6 (RAMP superfamily)
MPLSAVIYTSLDAFASIRDAVRKSAEGLEIKPYTFSFAHKLETGAVRVRATELAQGALMPVVGEMVKRGEATLASRADREVGEAAYEELIEDADRARRVATIRFASPTIVEVQGERVPFPVIGAIFARYREIWSAFSPVPLPPARQAMEHVHVTDFKISCAAAGPIGAAAEGWVTLEMERGRTEQEIALFNTLVDFAFYCGTGAYTDEGLGQTRRMEGRHSSPCAKVI